MPRLIFNPSPQRKEKVARGNLRLLYSANKNYWISESRYRSDPPKIRSTSFVLAASSTGSVINAMPLPAGYQTGDLLIIHAGYTQNNNYSAPVGWTELAQNLATGSSWRNKIFYKIAEGNEGESLTITFGENASRAASAFAIEKDTFDPMTPPEALSNQSGNVTDNPIIDPPALTPSWGSANTLYVLTAFRGGGSSGAVTVPYGNNSLDEIPTSNQGASVANMAFDSIVSNQETFDPDPFILSQAYRWGVWTIAVRPLE